MASALVEASSYDASVVTPDGGDPRTASSVRVAFQALANRTKFLKAGFDATNIYISQFLNVFNNITVLRARRQVTGGGTAIGTAGTGANNSPTSYGDLGAATVSHSDAHDSEVLRAEFRGMVLGTNTTDTCWVRIVATGTSFGTVVLGEYATKTVVGFSTVSCSGYYAISTTEPIVIKVQWFTTGAFATHAMTSAWDLVVDRTDTSVEAY